MGNNVGIGVVCFVCSLIVVILGAAQPTLLIQTDEWTLINVLDDDNGLWMNEDGDLKIDSSEDHEVGETCEFEVDIDIIVIVMMICLGGVYMIIGIVCFVYTFKNRVDRG